MAPWLVYESEGSVFGYAYAGRGSRRYPTDRSCWADDVWKLYMNNIDIDPVKAMTILSGDESLGLTVLRTVAIIA